MTRFNVYLGNEMIGWSNLEFGDPPMGVAFGKFVPNDNYKNMDTAQRTSLLAIRTDAGVPVRALAVHIEDRAELGAEGMEVSVLGIFYPEYETLFPQHVAAYERD